MSDFQYFLKWLSENSCLSVVLVWLIVEGIVGVAKVCRPTKRTPDEGNESEDHVVVK